MNTSRRCMLTMAGASLLWKGANATRAPADPGLGALIRESEAANQALMRGDARRYLALVRLAEDFTLMSPFGGTPSKGGNYSPEKTEALGRFFRNGTLRQEVVRTYASDDIAVLAVIEHSYVEVGGLPAQNWALRVTLVYRRENGVWSLVHRHADPLAPGIGLEEAAALAGRALPMAAASG